jgi:hypothetical protein
MLPHLDGHIGSDATDRVCPDRTEDARPLAREEPRNASEQSHVGSVRLQVETEYQCSCLLPRLVEKVRSVLSFKELIGNLLISSQAKGKTTI